MMRGVLNLIRTHTPATQFFFYCISSFEKNAVCCQFTCPSIDKVSTFLGLKRDAFQHILGLSGKNNSPPLTESLHYFCVISVTKIERRREQKSAMEHLFVLSLYCQIDNICSEGCFSQRQQREHKKTHKYKFSWYTLFYILYYLSQPFYAAHGIIKRCS